MSNPSLLSNSSPVRPFLNPSPLRLNPQPLPKRLRYRVSLPRNSSDSTSASSSSQTGSDVFGPHKELVGILPVVDKLSPPVRLATSAIVIAGFKLGFRYGGNRNVAIGGAAVFGAAAGAVSYAMNAAVPEVTAVRLHDYVAGCDDPGAVKREDIEAIANKSKYMLSRPASIVALMAPMAASFLLLLNPTNLALYLSMALIGVCTGAITSISVATTTELFGAKNFSVNHNVVVANIPIGSFVYGYLAALVYRQGVAGGVHGDGKCMGLECYRRTFILWSCLCFLGTFLALALYVRTRKFYSQRL